MDVFMYWLLHVFDNGDSYFWLPSDIDKDIWLLFSAILVLAFLIILLY
jgi:hypothetical protein